MWECMRNAWSGWLAFTDGGKLAVPLIALTGYLVCRRGTRGPQRRLAVYGGIAVSLCILPVTAAVLMKYQTAFYDYPWIWSIVPFTALIALGGTVFLSDYLKRGKGWRTVLYNGALILLCAGVLTLCGGPGESGEESVAERERRENAAAVLEELCVRYGEDGRECRFCLWAPREIMEYARAENGNICLLYGRNMWDVSLDAYSYDVCTQEQRELYQWMEQLAEEEISIGATRAQEYVRKAFSMGADCILLPGEWGGSEPILTGWGEDGVETEQLGRYYLVRMR